MKNLLSNILSIDENSIIRKLLIVDGVLITLASPLIYLISFFLIMPNLDNFDMTIDADFLQFLAFFLIMIFTTSKLFVTIGLIKKIRKKEMSEKFRKTYGFSFFVNLIMSSLTYPFILFGLYDIFML